MPVLSTSAEDASRRLAGIDWSPLGGIRDAVLPAVRRVLEGAAGEAVVDRLLRTHRGWDAPARAAAVEAVFGVALWRRRLAWHAGHPEPAPELAPVLLACLLRDLAGLPTSDTAALLGCSAAGLPSPRPPPEAPAVRHSFPDWLYRVFERELGGSAEPFANALNRKGPLTVRANTARISREALRARLADEGVAAEPTALSPLGLTLSGRPNIFGLASHQQGLFEVQDEGSQLLGLLGGARPGDSVLDLCAGAGGKSLLLAAEVGPGGTVYAHDVDLERLDRLRSRAQRARLGNVRILSELPSALRVDRVLVDAPCSSLGALRRGPDVRFRLSEAALEPYPPLQLRLLARARAHLKPGGRLVYGTCTLRSEENADLVDAFAGQHPDLQRVGPAAPWLTPSLRQGMDFRCLPHLHGTDGFYGAVLEAHA